MVFRISLLIVLILFTATNVYAESGDDLRAKAQNPVSSMYSLPLKLTLDFGAPKDEAVFFNINPVIPVTVGGWNLVNRFIIPAIVSVDGFIGGTPDIPSGAPSQDRETGLGDINYSLYFSPGADPRGFAFDRHLLIRASLPAIGGLFVGFILYNRLRLHHDQSYSYRIRQW